MRICSTKNAYKKSYSFNLHDGVLTIHEGTSIENVNVGAGIYIVKYWTKNGSGIK